MTHDAGDGDHDLMIAIGQGRRQAFHTLMQRHLASIVALAHRLVGNQADADEIAQEVFLRVWVTAPRWRPDGEAKLTTWLYRVTVNLCLDRRRRVTALPLEAAGDPVDPLPSSLDRVVEQDAVMWLNQALSRLPERQRGVLALCYFGETTASDAAQILDLSVSAVEALLVRGRRSLRKNLSALGIVEMGDLR
ncbi:MAG: RNA polymerase sigma factor [Azospirillaceae bacterium]|nr:RNA polymerase sigma factor [Azospirillaceae bacterium]